MRDSGSVHVPEKVPEKSAPNLGDLLEDALLQARNLVQAELALARAELKVEVSRTVSSMLMLVGAAMFFQAALATLGVLLVLSFGAGFAAAAVVIGLALIGVGLAFSALRALDHKRLPKTTARLSNDAKQVLETVK